MSDTFEYGGYHFTPHRQFRKGEVERRLAGDSRPWKKARGRKMLGTRCGICGQTGPSICQNTAMKIFTPLPQIKTVIFSDAKKPAGYMFPALMSCLGITNPNSEAARREIVNPLSAR